MSHYFITGTDTGVGKTHVTALLLAELRRRGINAAGFKPIACGADGRHDARRYRQIMNDGVSLDLLNPVYLRRPLAPSVAARLADCRVDMRKVFRAYRELARRYDVVLAEGAGGLMVPIRNDYFVVDMMREMELPVVVVARLGLGTINHTLMTVSLARVAGLEVAGIVLNDTTGRRGLAERTNVSEVPRVSGCRLLGVVPHGERPGARYIRRMCDKLILS